MEKGLFNCVHVVGGALRKVCTTVCMLLEAHGERFVQLCASCWRRTEKGLYNCVHVVEGAWKRFVQLCACCWRCTEKGLYNCVHVVGGAWRKV